MRSLFVYKLYILLYWPRYVFLSKKGKAMFCLNYLFPNRYAYVYSVFQAHMESGNFTNSNTLSNNNPFNFVYSTNLGVPAIQAGNWSKFLSIADCCYAYAYWVHKHPQIQLDMVDNAPNVYANNDACTLEKNAAADYFALVSADMVAAGYVANSSGNSYNQSIFAYYLSSCDANGNLKAPFLVWYIRYGIPLSLLVLISLAIWYFFFKKKKPSVAS